MCVWGVGVCVDAFACACVWGWVGACVGVDLVVISMRKIFILLSSSLACNLYIFYLQAKIMGDTCNSYLV